VVNESLDIEGPGACELTVSGNEASRIFDVLSGIVTIAGMTIARGLAHGLSPILASTGGGILNSGKLSLSHDVLYMNQALGSATTVNVFGFAVAGIGGAIANFGKLTVTAC
jgi:hypothetical protein